MTRLERGTYAAAGGPVRRTSRRLLPRLGDELSERLRIARELHDTLLQGLVSASLQLHVAVGQLPPDSPSRPLLERVQQLVRQAIEQGRNTVRGLRSADRDPGDLAEAFARVREHLADQGRATLRISVEGAPRALRPAVREEVYGIGREALVNAIRHSAASRIEVALGYGSRGLRLLVRDDGSGIAPEVQRSGRDGHFGLPGMWERAERVGGRLAVWSAPGAGTRVVLSVRGALAFASTPIRPETGQAAG